MNYARGCWGLLMTERNRVGMCARYLLGERAAPGRILKRNPLLGILHFALSGPPHGDFIMFETKD